MFKKSRKSTTNLQQQKPKQKSKQNSKINCNNLNDKCDSSSKQNVPINNNNNKKNNQKAKPPDIKEGDWICESVKCQNINWAKRAECNL